MQPSFLRTCKSLFLIGFALAPSVVWCGPDAGSQIRQFQDETVLRVTLPKPAPRIEAQDRSTSLAAPPPTGDKILVKSFIVHGVSQFTDAEVATLLKPYTGRDLDAAGIHAAADALAQMYRGRGYFASRVYIPPQEVAHTIRLDVYEGFLETPGIEVLNTGTRVTTSIVQGILEAHLLGDAPIHREAYERALLIAEDLPGITTASTLYPGSRVGTARLRTVVTDQALIAGNFDVDNFGSRTTGQVRLGATLYVNSPSGAGDQLVGRVVTSGRGSQYVYATYLRPVSFRGTRLGVSLDQFRYNADFITSLGYSNGRASDLRLYATHPLIRSRHGNLTVRADVSHLSLDDRNDKGINPRRHVDTVAFALQGDDDHPWLATGLTTFAASATAGQVDVRGNAAYQSADASTAATAGGFLRLNLNATRLTRLSHRWSLLTSLKGQWASRDLDSSQRFYIGGATSVAGYPTGEASGDLGAEISGELRHDLLVSWRGTLQVAAFFEQGWIRMHKTPWLGWQSSNPQLRNSFSLRAVGVNLLATFPDGWVARGAVGRQLGRNPMQDPTSGQASDGKASDCRAWLQLIRYF